MGHFVTFSDEAEPAKITRLVLNLVDNTLDAGAVAHRIFHSLETLITGPAVQINSDSLIDYRAQRPFLNYKDGALVGMRREGISLSYALDVEGQPFLLLHGSEPDFHWSALVADMIEVIEYFGVDSVYSFSSVPANIPHTRPADMVVRSTKKDTPVFESDFWFPAAFANYLEYHLTHMGVDHTDIAVLVPAYLAAAHYSAGALAVLGMASSLSGLHFPIGDLEQDADNEQKDLAMLSQQSEEFANTVETLEREYDENDSKGFVTAPSPELSVPSMEEIGRAAEQFLAGAANLASLTNENNDPLADLVQKLGNIHSESKRGSENTEGEGSTHNADDDLSSEDSRPHEDSRPRRGKHSA